MLWIPGTPVPEGAATGTLKWFDTVVKYGFILPDKVGKDVFLHISAVEAFGLSTIPGNTRVAYTFTQDSEGRRSAQLLCVGTDDVRALKHALSGDKIVQSRVSRPLQPTVSGPLAPPSPVHRPFPPPRAAPPPREEGVWAEGVIKRANPGRGCYVNVPAGPDVVVPAAVTDVARIPLKKGVKVRVRIPRGARGEVRALEIMAA